MRYACHLNLLLLSPNQKQHRTSQRGFLSTKWSPGGGEPILVSSGPFWEICICTNTAKCSRLNAQKNAKIEQQVLELWRFHDAGTKRGRTYLGEFWAVLEDMHMH